MSRSLARQPRRAMRPLWTLAGLLSLAVGILGIFLPVLPTTPLVLLAAFCFGKGSPRLRAWILEHRRFGPMIADWEATGA
ncbi:MAG: YbaN family protein, partial [Pseudomonadota bacterium]|nr:YbaN family protein [Pseudomonadota bacterium]